MEPATGTTFKLARDQRLQVWIRVNRTEGRVRLGGNDSQVLQVISKIVDLRQRIPAESHQSILIAIKKLYE